MIVESESNFSLNPNNINGRQDYNVMKVRENTTFKSSNASKKSESGESENGMILNDEVERTIKMKDESFISSYYAIVYDESETFLKKYPCPDSMISFLLESSVQNNRMKTLKRFLNTLKKKGPSLEFKRLVKTKFIEAFTLGNSGLIKILSRYLSSRSMAKHLMKNLKKKNLYCFHFILDNISKKTKRKIVEFLKDAAVNKGSSSAYKALFELGFDPNGNHKKGKGLTYLMKASSEGHIGIVKLLVKRGAYINQVNNNGTALLFATEGGHLEIVKYLLKKGADPTLSDQKGFTPLLCASYKNSFELFSLIFKKDKNVHQKSEETFTPLMHACAKSNVDIVRALVDSGADVNQVLESGYNCLHYAAKRKGSLEIFLYLIEKVNNLEYLLKAINIQGRSPLNIIRGHRDSSYTSKILNSKPELYKILNLVQPFHIIDNENMDICSICHDEFLKEDYSFKLPCKHVFHRYCVIEWIQLTGSCPYCRRADIKLSF
jgi:hypothetical protein